MSSQLSQGVLYGCGEVIERLQILPEAVQLPRDSRKMSLDDLNVISRSSYDWEVLAIPEKKIIPCYLAWGKCRMPKKS